MTFWDIRKGFGISNPQTHLESSQMHFGMKQDASRPISSKYQEQENEAYGSIAFIAPVLQLFAPSPMPSSIYMEFKYINLNFDDSSLLWRRIWNGINGLIHI